MNPLQFCSKNFPSNVWTDKSFQYNPPSFVVVPSWDPQTKETREEKRKEENNIRASDEFIDDICYWDRIVIAYGSIHSYHEGQLEMVVTVEQRSIS